MPPQIVPKLTQYCREVVETFSERIHVYSLVFGDQLAWFEARFFPESLQKQENAIVFVRDITIQKNLEIDLRNVTNMLQSIIGDYLFIYRLKKRQKKKNPQLN